MRCELPSGELIAEGNQAKVRKVSWRHDEELTDEKQPASSLGGQLTRVAHSKAESEPHPPYAAQAVRRS